MHFFLKTMFLQVSVSMNVAMYVYTPPNSITTTAFLFIANQCLTQTKYYPQRTQNLHCLHLHSVPRKFPARLPNNFRQNLKFTKACLLTFAVSLFDIIAVRNID